MILVLVVWAFVRGLLGNSAAVRRARGVHRPAANRAAPAEVAQATEPSGRLTMDTEVAVTFLPR